MKWIAPTLAYLAVGIGVFQFHSACGALLGFHFAIVISLLVAKPDIPVSTLRKSTNARWIFLSVLFCGSSGVILYFCWRSFGITDDIAGRIAALGLNPRNWLFFIAYFATVNPFVEEYFWRGYLGSQTKGFYISDFLYAGFHGMILIGKVYAGSIILALLLLTLAGWFWRQIAREDRGLLAPVLGHVAADLTILLAVYLNA